jgi:O-antigen/teichoic acid export membrane protein
LFFGQAFAPSALVLAIIFWSGPAVFPSVARAQVLVSRGQVPLELPAVALNAALRLGLAVLLVPRYGAIGAAVAITAAHWLSFYGTLLAIPPLRAASQPQLHAFRALLAPWETIRSLRDFLQAMLGRK